MGSGGSGNLTYFVSGRRRRKFCGFEIPKTRFLKGKPPTTSSISPKFRLRRLGMWRIFVPRPPEAKILRIWPLKMRFLKGKSPRKKLKFVFFRAAGAPILEFFDHNPKFVKKGRASDPPLYSKPIWADLLRRGGGSDTFNCSDMGWSTWPFVIRPK